MTYYEDVLKALSTGPKTLREITKEIYPELEGKDLTYKAQILSRKLSIYRKGGYINSTIIHCDVGNGVRPIRQYVLEGCE